MDTNKSNEFKLMRGATITKRLTHYMNKIVLFFNFHITLSLKNTQRRKEIIGHT